jgi:predicted dehydrogenase
VSAKGVSAVHHGGRLGFRFASSDAEQIFAEPEIDIVCIATRHDSHAEYVQKALRAGKSIFVEKPLALNLDQLKSIESAFLASRQGQTQPLLMVGFNRRFAPLSVKIKSLLAAVREPKSFIMTINAGSVPKDHWVQNPEIGGGRLIGEACHFIDFLRHLAGSPIRDFHVTPLYGPAGPAQSASISLQFEDGSFGVINYLANGNREYPKERLEIYTEGKILVLDNFRSLTGFGWPKFSKMRTWRQNKGQAECVLAFVTAVKTAMPSPIPLPELLEVSRIAILAAQRTT